MLQAVFIDAVDAITVKGLYQWDVGQKLQITLAALPSKFQVHFANKREDIAYVVEGTASNGVGTVDIPNIILQKAVGAKAWIYISDGKSGETIKTIDLPIVERAKPSDYIYKEIEILNYEKIIAEAEASVSAAAKSESNAKASATAASASAATADAAKNYVEAIVAGNEAYTKHETDTTYASVIAQKATGSPILIKGSSNKPVLDFSGFGRSEQTQYTGKNLLTYPYFETSHTEDNVKWVDNGDGTITANGTVTAGETSIFYFAKEYTLPKGRYIMTGCPAGGSTRTYDLRFIEQVGTDILFSVIDTGNGVEIELTEQKTVYVFARIAYETTVNNLTFKPMIRLASIADNTYEPYVGGIASPNPDYPQDIASVGEGGTLEVKSEGKNLLSYPYKNTTSTVNGITYTDNGDGSVTMNGTATADAIFLLSPVYLKAGTYTLSVSDSGFNSNYCNFQLSNSENNVWWGIKNATSATGVNTYTLNQDLLFNYNRLLVKAGHTMNNVTWKPMVRMAEIEDDSYELYKSSSVSIPLSEPLRSIDNVKDEIACVDGVYGVIRRIKSEVFKGASSENWIKHATQNNVYCRIFNDAKSGLNTSTWSHYTNVDVFPPTVGKKYDNTNNGWKYGYLEVETLAEWLAWLQANPVTIDYILAAEVFEPFENQALFDALETYDKVTYITATDNAEMEVTYATDTKSYIDNKFAELQATLVNLL